MAVQADQCVSIGDAFAESPKARALPVEFEVAHPPSRSDERWTVPAYLVRHAAGAKGEEPDLGLLQHRNEPTADARAAKGRLQRGAFDKYGYRTLSMTAIRQTGVLRQPRGGNVSNAWQ